MVRKFPAIIFIVCACVASSCGRGARLPEDLSRAEGLLDSRPDSSLIILDSASYSESSGRYLYASYCLLRTFAEYNAYKPGIDEGMMNVGVDYFLNTATVTGRRRRIILGRSSARTTNRGTRRNGPMICFSPQKRLKALAIICLRR